MKDLLFYIKQRLKTKHSVKKICSLIILYLKLLIKKDFYIINFDQVEIDVVIPTISKDYEILGMVIKSLKNLKQKINKTYVVSNDNSEIKKFCLKNNCIFIEESSILDYKKNIINYKYNGVDRSGWIYQQLLKLSGDKFTEKDNYLIVDSDTIFVSENSFLEDSKFIFFQNKEWHEPYFKAFKKLFGYEVINSLSFTSHMMIFNKRLLKEMKDEIEKKHSLSWDKVYLLTIDQNENSCTSDYDNYANWVLANHPEKVIKKPLYNIGLNRDKFKKLEKLEEIYGKNYKTISFHSYIK